MGEGNWFSGPSPICPFPETIFQYDETPLIDLWSPYIEGNKIAVENWKIKQTLGIVVIKTNWSYEIALCLYCWLSE